MKTTKEDRELYKMQRRFSGLERLVRKLNYKCERSEQSLIQIKEICKKIADDPNIQMHIESIRRAN